MPATETPQQTRFFARSLRMYHSNQARTTCAPKSFTLRMSCLRSTASRSAICTRDESRHAPKALHSVPRRSMAMPFASPRLRSATAARTWRCHATNVLTMPWKSHVVTNFWRPRSCRTDVRHESMMCCFHHSSRPIKYILSFLFFASLSPKCAVCHLSKTFSLSAVSPPRIIAAARLICAFLVDTNL